MSTRTYAMRAQDKPDWMIVAPINPLTEQQWKVLYGALELLRMREERDWPLHYVTTHEVAALVHVSISTVGKAFKKLCDMGLLRRSGRRAAGYAYYRKVSV